MLTDAYNVAFRRDVKILRKKSFNDTIDVEFGVYRDGKMTVNLMPSDGAIDWKINLDFLNKKVRPSYAKADSKVKIHQGFLGEWMKNRTEFFSIMDGNSELIEALLANGLYCVGRSKGASEAVIIGLDIVRNYAVKKESVFLGVFEGAKTGNKAFCESVERYIPKANIYNVRYNHDIITQIPPGFNSNPGIKIRVGESGLLMPIVDHALGCFKEEELQVFARYYDLNYGDGRQERVRITR